LAAGNGLLVQESRTDPLIGTTTFAYDPFNRRTGITDVNGVLTETEYDALDRVRFVRQRGASVAEDLVTEYRYNTFGDLFQMIYPEGNAAGRLMSMERKADDQPTTSRRPAESGCF
jgi:YD repeat-containing protein